MDQLTIRSLREAPAPNGAAWRLPPGVTDPAAPRFDVRRAAAAAAAVLALAALAWPMLPRGYEATASLVMRPTDWGGQPERVQPMRHPLDESAILSELDALSSVALADLVIARHGLADDPEFNGRGGPVADLQARLGMSAGAADPRRRLRAHMVVSRDRRSYTVRVGFRSRDPVKALALAETLVAGYLDGQIARKRHGIDAMARLLQERVEAHRHRADASAAAVADWMGRTGLIDRGAQVSLDAQLTALSAEAATARARMIDAAARMTSLAALKAAGALDRAPEVLASATVQRLKQSLTESLARPAIMSAEARSIDDQLAAEYERILTSVGTEAETWTRREDRLQAELRAIRAQIVARQRAEFELERLRREQANDAAVLDEALTQLKGQTAATWALRPDAEVISPAIMPDRPTFPDLPLYGGGALVLALLAALTANAHVLLRDGGRGPRE